MVVERSEVETMFIVGAESTDVKRVVWVTWVLVALNLFGFCLQLVFRDPITYGFSLVPAEVTTGRDLVGTKSVKVRTVTPGRKGEKATIGEEWVNVPQHPGPVPIQLTLLTSMFLHGGWLHLIGNMWFLIVFGGHVERCMGPRLYLTAYLFCGLAGGLAHVFSDPNSCMPCLGASGAISGVLGAYLFLQPFGKVSIWLIAVIIRIPAFFVLGFWLILQCAGAMTTTTGVAYWAHLGGFFAGPVFIVCVIAFLKMRGETQAPEAEPEKPLTNFMPLETQRYMKDHQRF
jgi:membrane associated rhomboid family serine protease